MCLVPVPGHGETYRHVDKQFIYTIKVDQAKLNEIAKLLGIPPGQAATWQPGNILVVNDTQGGLSKK
jgi:hypothetical protein